MTYVTVDCPNCYEDVTLILEVGQEGEFWCPNCGKDFIAESTVHVKRKPKEE